MTDTRTQIADLQAQLDATTAADLDRTHSAVEVARQALVRAQADRREAILEARYDGWTVGRIAEQLGLTRQHVSVIANHGGDDDGA